MQTDVIPCHKALTELHTQEMDAHNDMLKDYAPMKLKASIQTSILPSQVCKK